MLSEGRLSVTLQEIYISVDQTNGSHNQGVKKGRERDLYFVLGLMHDIIFLVVTLNSLKDNIHLYGHYSSPFSSVQWSCTSLRTNKK